ncbi:MAG: DUF423 domain-containing protein [Candidatus Eremiobacteraeota bacterium]|nr:DUF423 domain-containing protein [Candidatus Eremiobacteraeota bacterium]MCW5872882.1 DUF423 domain-containing protein [Candidatus Eremiobacteraeota bacterium]
MRAFGFLLAALGIALGAFGAHALKGSLSPELLNTWETAVRYQMYAAFGIQLGCLQKGSHRPVWFLALGWLLFSGSLYLLCLTGLRWLGAITPLGGLAMIAGWLLLGREALKHE